MRFRYFGDRQDTWKWAELRALLQKDRSKLFYVAMLTDLCWPCKDDNPNNDELILEFQRLLDDITIMTERRLNDIFLSKLPQTVEVIASGYRKSERATFFEMVSGKILNHKLRSPSDPLIIFLDPDTGLCPDSGGDDGHLMRDSLEILLKSISENDALLIYQHRQRVRDNLSDYLLRERSLKALLADLKINREPMLIDSSDSFEAYFIKV